MFNRRILGWVWLRIHGVECAFGSVVVVGRPRIIKARGSRIVIGRNVKLISDWRYNPSGMTTPVTLVTLSPRASIIIGNDAALSGCVICSSLKVTIGEFSMMGANSKIYDTDFHFLEATPRRLQSDVCAAPSAPVCVGSHTWIGFDCLLLKGAQLGDGSVLGARSVLTSLIHENMLAVGSPAKALRSINNSK